MPQNADSIGQFGAKPIDGDPFCIPAWIVTLCGGDLEDEGEE